MKRYLSNFKLTEQFVLKSMLECLSHKTNNKVRWNRKDTSYFLADYYVKGGFAESENMHKIANFIHNDIHNNFAFYRDVLAPYIAGGLFMEIKNRNIRLSPINYQERIDPSSGKIREIGITSIKQQVYDYICVNALKPMLDAKNWLLSMFFDQKSWTEARKESNREVHPAEIQKGKICNKKRYKEMLPVNPA